MSVRDILLFPDRRLRMKAREVGEFSRELAELAEDLLETMYAAPGIGLAATQLGVMKRLFVMDCSQEDEAKNPRVLVNPRIVWASEEKQEREEGCLSLPGQFAEVTRPATVVVGFQNLEGADFEEQLDGLQARCAQHEIDHLDGKLFIHRISSLKRQIIARKAKKALREAQQN
ncbi:MAG: peptide deformylase, partial [Albidovulum sp.]|nr:peptide deformylase [Albidovulum sp.]